MRNIIVFISILISQLAGTGLKIYGARKHYLIFDILPDDRIAIVAFEKKERDILGILSKRSAEIRKSLSYLRQ